MRSIKSLGLLFLICIFECCITSVFASEKFVARIYTNTTTDRILIFLKTRDLEPLNEEMISTEVINSNKSADVSWNPKIGYVCIIPSSQNQIIQLSLDTENIEALSFIAENKENQSYILSWGTHRWNRLRFRCARLFISTNEAPLFGYKADLSGMFKDCKYFNEDISHWDLRDVERVDEMFEGCESFNQPIGNWDVASIENMERMFYGCLLFNQPIERWDVRRVKSMNSMFYRAETFNQPLGAWDVSNVENMTSMFERATSFNQNLGNWTLHQKVNLGLQQSGMDIENYSKTLSGWAQKLIRGVTVEATGLNYHKSGQTARRKLTSQMGYTISGDKFLAHYVFFRKPEVFLGKGQEVELKVSSGGVSAEELARGYLDVEDNRIVEVLDSPSGLRIRCLQSGRTRLIFRVPARENVYDELETTCIVHGE